ncbi:SGNH/GDSL hydrolase family protein [Campylobacter insulaenigrae]|uniref:SGNH/GDSL hydrolase family protein n=1 Tax=Campylobacter insulaenigrae TaxID=260714 RepID=UPI002152B200|nr:SGNH/GDSL hydrolase family protein [Campylobacter insulaenigrae]MCR6587601.1 SGNH/GDSL hydrolase family protein [Campylobacter insulaenigrae]
MRNVVLLGASNSKIFGGLKSGLSQDNVNLNDLSIGGTASLHKLYCLKREENQEMIREADLIIVESNIMDISILSFLELNVVIRNIKILYSYLSKLNCKILILILFDSRALNDKKSYMINNLHRFEANRYEFNIIDVDHYVNINKLNKFFLDPDPFHMLASIMYRIGKNIIQAIDDFHISYKYNKRDKNIYEVLNVDKLKRINKDLEIQIIRDMMYKEKVCCIDKNIELKLPKELNGFKIIGIHTFNNTISNLIKKNIQYGVDYQRTLSYSSLVFSNTDQKLIKSFWGYNIFVDISNDFMINNTNMKFNTKLKYSEPSFQVGCFNNFINTLDHVNLVALFLFKENYFENMESDSLNKSIFIAKKNNFSYLIPDLLLIKNCVEEYNARMDSVKLTPLQTQISILTQQNNLLGQQKNQIQKEFEDIKNVLNSLPYVKQQLEISNLTQDLENKKLYHHKLQRELGVKFVKNININFVLQNTAKFRIQNQLAYKLGQAMIVNSKSFLGYIRMPFVLSYIKDKHKQEQKIYQEKIKKDSSLKLPSLEQYPDYQEALKEKECFTYKLGQALIQANKNWYGGGISSCGLKLGS